MPLVQLVSAGPDGREPYRLWLERQGYRVLVHDRAEQAVEHAARAVVDACVIEVFEPESEALRELRLLRGARDLRRVPLVVLASWPADPRRRGELAWARWLVKPVSPSALGDVVLALVPLR